MNLAPSTQLAQSRPSGTTAAAIYTPSRKAEILYINICNSTGSAATFQLYHDDDGTTYDQSTALYYNKSVAANDTITINANMLGGGLPVNVGGNIAFQTGTGSALTITLYGVTQQGK